MSYFKSFPRIAYSFDDGKTARVCVDILTRVGLRQKVKDFSEFFSDYDVEEGERPEILADRIYGDPELHWTILVANDIHNQYYEWPLSQRDLESYMKRKHPGSSWFLTGYEGNTYPAEVSFTVNETVHGVSGNTYTSGSDGSISGLDFNGKAALVHDWDKTYSRLVVTGVTDSGITASGSTFAVGDLVATASISGGSTVYNVAMLGRYVDISYEAVHHFEDIDKNYLNPYATPPDATGDQFIVGHTASAGGTVAFGDTVLQNYIASDTNTNVYTITNSEEMFKDNETKRSIKLIKPEFVSMMVQELRDVIQGNE